MLMKALDLLRTIGWAIVHFIYSLIDSLYDIIKEINALDIVSSVSGDSIFKKLYTGIFAIAVTTLALFTIWKFVKKLIEPEDGITPMQIFRDAILCTILVLISTFLFSQASDFSIKLSGYAGNVFESKETSLADNMLTIYVSFTEAYEVSDEFENEDYAKAIANENFTKKKMYKDKFVTDHNFILPDEKEYKYDINWIMAIIVGGFFLYALFYSGMMLARRQIEFLFLFTVSPIIIATSVGNKERRQTLFQQLISLILQGAVIMLIIGLSVILMRAIQTTTFFDDSVVKDMVTKSILYIGCGMFLLTGSQTINKFISSNISAAAGREQLASMMGFRNAMTSGAVAGGMAAVGTGMVGTGAVMGAAGKLGGNKAVSGIGNAISKFGRNISSKSMDRGGIGGAIGKGIGNTISSFGNKVGQMTPSALGKNMRTRGYRNVADAISTMDPTKNIYRRRYNRRI